jgi:hypothetical protein
MSPFLGYVFHSGVIAYGPLILLMLAVITVELIYAPYLTLKKWVAVIIWLPYVIIASYYYLKSPFDGRYLTTHFLVILTLPVVILSLIRLKDNKGSHAFSSFIYKYLFLFIVMQLGVCIGQISTYQLGFGFPVSEMHAKSFMVSGTFTNSNDLGVVVLIFSFIFTQIEKEISKKQVLITWMVIALLIIICGSRSALLITSVLFIFTRGISGKSLFLFLLLLLIGGIAFSTLSINIESGVFLRFNQRIDSLYYVFQNGLSADGSMAIRMQSYMHFIENIGRIGLGSEHIGDYFQYSEGANFNPQLMFQNPHSLIVELGYWLGWPGLLFFIIAAVYMIQFSGRKLQLILVLGVSTMISSSVLGSLIYFMFFNCAFFIKNKPLYR